MICKFNTCGTCFNCYSKNFNMDCFPCEDADPMTNADRIRAMTDEELSEFLSSIAYGRETPWCEQFAEKFCKSCPTTTCTAEGHHHPMDLHECDFTDGKCPHGRDIVWWLQQPAGEEDKHETD